MKALNAKGFSCLELLIVLTIVGVVAGFGAHGLSMLLTRHHNKTALLHVENTVGLARALAAKSQLLTQICPSEDEKNCSSSGTSIIILQKNNCVYHKSLPALIQWRGFPAQAFARYEYDGLSETNGHFSAGTYRLLLCQGGRLRWA